MSSIDPAPPVWRRARLSEVVEINPRRFTEVPDDNSLVSFVPMKAIEEESGRLSALTTRRWSEVKKGYTIFQEGDVLFAKITPCMENGKFALAKGLYDGRGAGSTELYVFRPSKEIDAQFLLHFLFRPSLRRDARAQMRGAAGQLRVPPGFFEELEIPVPPLGEQNQIVAEIEKQSTRVEVGAAALRRVQANLKRYRAAVLKAASEGQLVPTEAALSRAKKRAYETAKDHMSRILDERYRERPIRAVSPNITNLHPLPEGWTWTNAEQLSTTEEHAICAGPFGTIFKAKDFRSEGVPIIFLRHVAPGRYLTSKPGFMDENKWDELFRPYSVFGGELLVTKLGDPPGVCAIYPHGIGPAMVTPDVIKMSVNPNAVIPAYLMYYINSERARNFSTGAAFGTTRLRLSLPIFRQMPVPLPPLAEQARIVSEVERRLSLVDELEVTTSVNIQRAASLRQSILQRAFSGGTPNAIREGNGVIVHHAPSISNSHASPDSSDRPMPRNPKTQGAKGLRAVVDVLREANRAFTPEDLFTLCGRDQSRIEDVEQFFTELRLLVSKGEVEEVRTDSVLLRMKQ